MATPSKNPDHDLIDKLDLKADGARIVSLTFAVTIYTDATFSTIPEAVQESLDRFLKLCPREQLKFYLTESMRKHKPVTDRAMGMLKTWLKPGTPPREFIALELTDGEGYDWAPKFKYKIWGNEPESLNFGEDGNFIHMAFPPEWGFDRAAEMESLLVDLAKLIPYKSALAGFSFECSRYEKDESETFAWSKSMRHRGIDLFVHPYDTKAVGKDAIKGVNWLTALCDEFVERLGGPKKLRKALPEGIELVEIPRGLLIKAGPLPAMGDTNRRRNLPEYQAVYKALAPLAEPGYDRTIIFLAGDAASYEENTRRWQRRLAGG